MIAKINHENIYLMQPVNKSSALVVKQSHPASDRLTAEQEIDNLRAKSLKLQSDLSLLPKIKSNHRKRKLLGKRISETNRAICDMKGASAQRDISHYIIDVVKESMTNFQWNRVFQEARKRQEAENDS